MNLRQLVKSLQIDDPAGLRVCTPDSVGRGRGKAFVQQSDIAQAQGERPRAENEGAFANEFSPSLIEFASNEWSQGVGV